VPAVDFASALMNQVSVFEGARLSVVSSRKTRLGAVVSLKAHDARGT